MVKSTKCSSRRPEFNSQHLRGSSQASVTPVSEGPLTSSGLNHHQSCGIHKIYMQAKHPDTHKSNFIKLLYSLKANNGRSKNHGKVPMIDTMEEICFLNVKKYL